MYLDEASVRKTLLSRMVMQHVRNTFWDAGFECAS